MLEANWSGESCALMLEGRCSSRPSELCPGPARRGLVRSIRALLLLPLFVLVGCDSMGPGTVARDRFDYAGSVGESWKSQMLLNLVKIRYGDIPVFMDVGQVVAGYSMQRTVS